LTVREAAEATGLGEHTLRYYERIGLLDPVGRASNGHRRYAAEDLAWIEFLNRLRATGMPIRAMRRYADLRRAGPATAPERREMLEAHGRAVRARMEELGRNLVVIEAKVRAYEEMEAGGGEATTTDTLRDGGRPARGS